MSLNIELNEGEANQSLNIALPSAKCEILTMTVQSQPIEFAQ